MTDKLLEVERRSLSDLVSKLRISALWSLCLALVGLLAGSFSLGAWVGRSQLFRSEPLLVSAPWQFYEDLFPEDRSNPTGLATWNGEWLTHQQGKQGVILGRLWFTVGDEGAARGVFTVDSGTGASGALRGSLNASGNEMRGTWKTARQTGRFRFNLSDRGQQFSGLFSMSENTEPTNSSNTWEGRRSQN